MFMARMIECKKPVVRLLDPGAGVGSLSAAFVAEMCRREVRPDEISVTACELDPMLIDYLHSTLELCKEVSENAGIRFEARILAKDFLEVGASTFVGDLFAAGENERFDCAILNPRIGRSARNLMNVNSSATSGWKRAICTRVSWQSQPDSSPHMGKWLRLPPGVSVTASISSLSAVSF
jgi:hypothetical protein